MNSSACISLCAGILLASPLTFAATRYVNVNSAAPASPYSSWATATRSIQNAVDAAAPGDTILVTNGVYQTGGRVISGTLSNRVAVTKAVTIQSVNGPAVTSIRGYQLPGATNGDGAIRCIYLTNGAVLIGFTLTNGATRTSGDYYTESSGGGAYCESENVVVSNCFFTANGAFRIGGGVLGGTVNNSAFTGNSAGHGGGAANSFLNHCIFTNNVATYPNNGFGGAAYDSFLKNCLVRSNIAEYGGGGINGGWAVNCTIVQNSARFGGGASNCALTNTILYYNSALDRPNYYNQTLSRCCTEPPSGNSFSNAPLFVNAVGGNFQLTDLSLCVNAGENAVAPTGVDFAGNPRLVGTAVDIGAFELQTPFQLPTGPFTHTQAARAIYATNATLAGAVVPRGLPTVTWFEWGTFGNFNQRTAPQSAGSGEGLVTLSTNLSNLTPRGIYQFRLVASNALGVVTGIPQFFTTGRRVQAWGDNGNSQTNVPLGLNNAVAVSAGGSHSLALLNDGDMIGWGYNYYGQVNNQIALAGKVMAIAAGGTHSMALLTNKTVAVWGDNFYQQRFLPSGMSNVIAIAAGGTGSMALTEEGKVFAWGYNGFGQTNVPAAVTNIVAIEAGGSYNLALRADGVVLAWGENYDGETNVPPGLGGVVTIAAGWDHALSMRADGAVVGWGGNSSGETTIPVNLTNVLSLAAGGYHSIALQAAGNLVAWGGNYFNQLPVPANITHIPIFSAGGAHTLGIGNERPTAIPQFITAPRDDDITITLAATDADEETLTRRITTLPAAGQLFQFTNGTRGVAITTNQTIVADPTGRVIFAPVAGATGAPYATFDFIANDGWVDSTTAIVTVNLIGGAPFAFTQTATVLSTNQATLRGMVARQGLPTTAWFEWGTTNTTVFTTPRILMGNGITVTQLNATISNFTYATPQQFRLVVSNSSGLTYGFPQRFASGYRVRAWGDNSYNQTNMPAGLGTVAAIAAGGEFSLALRTDGTVAAWGIGSYGPTNVPAGLSNVTDIAAGYSHALALKSDGSVVAWGSLIGSSIIPAFVPFAASNVVAIAGGLGHSLALRADGTVVAWGLNPAGETDVPVGLSNVVAITVGTSHNLALRADGTVVAWGDYLQNKTVVPTGLSNVVGIEASSINSVVLKSTGTAEAWGGTGPIQNPVPPGISNLIALSVGGLHTLAMQADGTLLAWGDNSYGQGTIPPGLSNVASLSAGGRHNLALVSNSAPVIFAQQLAPPPNADVVVTLSAADPDNDLLITRITTVPAAGQLYQYTNNTRGALITTPETIVTDPQRRVIFAPVAGAIGNPYTAFSFTVTDGELDSGPATVTLAIFGPLNVFTRPAGEISPTSAQLTGFVAPRSFATTAWFEWGTNSIYGQNMPVADAGSGSGVVHLTQKLNGLAPGQVIHFRLVASNASQIVYGIDQQFLTSGKVFAWGDNSSGQSAAQTNLGPLIAVAGGLSHTLALGTDGKARAWGNNTYGQNNVPPGLDSVSAIASGGFHNLALRTNGSVVAWGRNNLGQTNVAGSASNVVAIAAGGQHSVALRADGSLVAWGDNSQGQRNISTALTNIVGIAAGWYHNVALRSDGTVTAWGANTYGQSNVPAGLTNIVWIGAGLYHSLALRRDGTLTAWGLNSSGQTNVPPGVTNTIASAAGGSHNLAMQSNGAVAGWGYNLFGQTTPPVSASNIVNFAAGGSHSLALLLSTEPVAFYQVVSGYPNVDLPIALVGTAPGNPPLTYRISSLPTAGSLYQSSGGTRSSLINAPGTVVSDPTARVIFAPAADQIGSPHANFTFVTSAGAIDSAAATVTINIVAPAAPTLDLATSRVMTNGAFQLAFSGTTNAAYRVWASTNLVNWELLGPAAAPAPGQFQFLDAGATNWPHRFYRASAP